MTLFEIRIFSCNNARLWDWCVIRHATVSDTEIVEYSGIEETCAAALLKAGEARDLAQKKLRVSQEEKP